MKLHKYEYRQIDGKPQKVKQETIHIWVPVKTATGEVELDNIHEYDDELEDLADGWEWRKLQIVEPQEGVEVKEHWLKGVEG